MRTGWIVAALALATPLYACAPEPEGKPILRTDMDGAGPNGEGEPAGTVEPAQPHRRIAHVRLPHRHIRRRALHPLHCRSRRAIASRPTSAPMAAPPIAALPRSPQAAPPMRRRWPLPSMAECSTAKASPIGYYVEGGERLEELNRADGPGNFHLKPNGVFFGTGDRWQVRDGGRFLPQCRRPSRLRHAKRPDAGHRRQAASRIRAGWAEQGGPQRRGRRWRRARAFRDLERARSASASWRALFPRSG